MLHLNEHGWGLSTLMGFIFVFLLAILLISVNAYKMGLTSGNVSNLPITRPGDNNNNQGSSDSDNNSDSFDNESTYLELESKLSSAAIMYKDTYYNGLVDGDSVYVTNKQLFSVGFLNDKIFNSGECIGYVKISNKGGSFEYTPYLNCAGKYQTSGFISDLDK